MPQNGNISVAITNTFARSTGRLVIKKANFVGTPAKPHEAFTFVVTKDGAPADLTADRVHIRKTGGSGEYKAVDLKNGRFTLKYDTEVTIDGLPLGTYSVTERVSGYTTTYEVIDNSVARPGDGTIVADITIIFTNIERDRDRDRDREPDRDPREPGPEDSPGTPTRPGGNTPETEVSVDIPLGPIDGSPDEEEPEQESPPEGPQTQLPRTGDGTGDGSALPLIPLLPLLPMVLVMAAALFFFSYKADRNWKDR